MTVGHSMRNTFGWMGALQAPQQFNGKVLVEVQGARHLEAPKNLRLMVPKSRSIIAQEYVDGNAFFHVHCSTKSQENPKGPKFSILKFFIRKKNVHVLWFQLDNISQIYRSIIRLSHSFNHTISRKRKFALKQK